MRRRRKIKDSPGQLDLFISTPEPRGNRFTPRPTTDVSLIGRNVDIVHGNKIYPAMVTCLNSGSPKTSYCVRTKNFCTIVHMDNVIMKENKNE